MGRMTVCFAQALAAWGSGDFSAVLKRDIERLSVLELPLQQGLTTGSYALDEGPGVMILGVYASEHGIHARARLFYRSVIAGCSCGDDPTPVDICNEQCEVALLIDKRSAETTIKLVQT